MKRNRRNEEREGREIAAVLETEDRGEEDSLDSRSFDRGQDPLRIIEPRDRPSSLETTSHLD